MLLHPLLPTGSYYMFPDVEICFNLYQRGQDRDHVLTKLQTEFIMKHYAKITDKMEMNNNLLEELHQAEVISGEQKNRIIVSLYK